MREGVTTVLVAIGSLEELWASLIVEVREASVTVAKCVCVCVCGVVVGYDTGDCGFKSHKGKKVLCHFHHLKVL